MAADPRDLGYRHPAEWEPHAACWMALPYRREEWGDELERAQRELVGLACAIAEPGVQPRGGLEPEPVHLLVPDGAHASRARSLARDCPGVGALQRDYGDSWTRDTAPLFLLGPHGELGAARFEFNGWGGRFRIPGDDTLAGRIAHETGARIFEPGCVLEGGALDTDGRGCGLTTRTCLLHPNRNPGMSEREWTATLQRTLGLRHVVWLEGSLQNDHTDGHVDTLARFIAPGVVVCMEPRTPEDPNRAVLRSIREQLRGARDADGQRLRVETLPSPGTMTDDNGAPLPASYCNFYVGNATVAVPTYDSPEDDEAVARLQELFPSRRVVGLPSRALLTGGGAFHCVTREQPVASGRRSAHTPNRTEARR